MEISQLPLNALRAFEASARLCSFTRAGLELNVTQTAVSHQVRALEEMLGITLFERLPRGLALTEEGHALLPVLTDAFRRMGAILSQLEEGNFHEILTVGAVSTFAVGWLLPRLARFQRAHPSIDLRLKTNNNRADMLADGLDFFIRFGHGAWHGTDAVPLVEAPLAPVCAPALAAGLSEPADLLKLPLLRSYRRDEWTLWFRAAGLEVANPRGWMFDSSIAMVEAAAQGAGVALVPAALFASDIASARIVQPFAVTVPTGRYWLTRLISHPETHAMQAFRTWLLEETG
ncbi:LysR family transcriptional regulator of beta-lactamase [Azospirillum fermentarium]|uniref:LysR family transcriptional regulator n=1 Tax=Azospirillum fermentarium TaxID=1233114 RepID=UPI0022273E84|nr:LysR family transcriptional regulator [Azospirillum fermentarium]MCW2245786.1 LysR family transcriptional regulator of beta-lactamase [Azospirillum fermentarium]